MQEMGMNQVSQRDTRQPIALPGDFLVEAIEQQHLVRTLAELEAPCGPELRGVLFPPHGPSPSENKTKAEGAQPREGERTRTRHLIHKLYPL